MGAMNKNLLSIGEEVLVVLLHNSFHDKGRGIFHSSAGKSYKPCLHISNLLIFVHIIILFHVYFIIAQCK